MKESICKIMQKTFSFYGDHSTKIHLVDSIISHQSEIEDHTHPKKHQFLLGERSQIRL
ncbi:MAG: hypothetical protein ACREBB_00900 [Nitrosotalea sp.]